MIFKKYKYLIAFVTLILICLVINFTSGFYYDNSNNVNVNYLINGSFVSGPLYLINTSGGFLYISYIVRELYLRLPHHNWFDLFMMGLNLIAFFQLFAIALFVFLGKNKNIKAYSIVALFTLAALWFDAFILIDETKISFFLAFASIYILTIDELKKPVVEYCCYAIFFLALMVRPEPVVLVWLLHMMFLVLVRGKFRFKILRVFRRPILVSLACIVLVSILLNVPLTKADAFYMTIRPYQYALWDFKYDKAGLVLKNKSDSTILKAASLYFLADKSKINDEYFKRIKFERRDKVPLEFWKYFLSRNILSDKCYSYFKNYLVNYWQLTTLIIVFALISLSVANSRYGILAFSILALGLVAGIALSMKMEYYVYIPLLVITITYVFLEIIPTYESRPGAVVWMLICLLFVLSFDKKVLTRYEDMAELQTSMDQMRANIERDFKGKILVYNLSSYDKLKSRLFGQEEMPQSSTCISVDNGWMYLYPEYDSYMEKIAGTSDFRGVMEYLKSRHGDVVFISASLRMEVLADYLHDVYGEDLNYNLISDPNGKPYNKNFWIQMYNLN